MEKWIIDRFWEMFWSIMAYFSRKTFCSIKDLSIRDYSRKRVVCSYINVFYILFQCYFLILNFKFLLISWCLLLSITILVWVVFYEILLQCLFSLVIFFDSIIICEMYHLRNGELFGTKSLMDVCHDCECRNKLFFKSMLWFMIPKAFCRSR